MSTSTSKPTSPKTPGSTSFSRNSPSFGSTKSNIQVICRLRPIQDIDKSPQEAVTPVDSKTLQITDAGITQSFTFDHVCGPEYNQADFFKLAGAPTLEHLFLGMNSTIFAYGQTGAGKSFTMFGDLSSNSEDRGIIPRVADEVFANIASGSADIEYTVAVSLMEVYKEQIIDLLDPQNKGRECSIHQDAVNGISVKGLKHAFVSSSSEMQSVFKRGQSLRKTASTLANPDSSRSHVIYQIYLTQKNTVSGELRKSRMFLVDLAGSEKVLNTGSSGNTLEEAKKINRSLSVLGLVINSLTDAKATHIPYRDSKLTRILQESLGGNSRTTLVINISPSLQSNQETLSTLRFGSRAKKIKNSAVINTELSTEQLKVRVAQLEVRNQELESLLKGQATSNLKSRRTLSANMPSNYDLKPLNSPALPSLSLTPSKISSPQLDNRMAYPDEMQRKDEKIAQLEQKILDLKLSDLNAQHEEDSKYIKLESSLHHLNDKLHDVERINENLKKHLLICEKIIAARDLKIERLSIVLLDQQNQVNRENAQFESKLRVLKSKIDAQKFREDSKFANYLSPDQSPAPEQSSHFSYDARSDSGTSLDGDRNHDQATQLGLSPVSAKMGFKLRIVKPLRGGKEE